MLPDLLLLTTQQQTHLQPVDLLSPPWLHKDPIGIQSIISVSWTGPAFAVLLKDPF